MLCPVLNRSHPIEGLKEELASFLDSQTGFGFQSMTDGTRRAFTKNESVLENALGYGMGIRIMPFDAAIEAVSNGKEQEEAQTGAQIRSEAPRS